MGLTTGNNEKYLRFWFEVNFMTIGLGMNREIAKKSMKKWFPYNKGGDFRKWYGNRIYVINWENDGHLLQTTMHPYDNRIWAHNFNLEFIFRKHLSWNDITSGTLAFRAFEQGFLFDSAAAVVFVPDDKYYHLLGYLNTKFVNKVSKLLNPTVHFKLGDYSKLPYCDIDNETIDKLAKNNIVLSKTDWDSFETSWDFTQHPLVRCASFSMEEMQEDKKKHICDMNYIREAYTNWENECFVRFNQLKSNEEELNRIFIDIYGLQNELVPDVEDKDVTVRKADLERDIRSFISYAVGCMFGRYSLEKEGLMFAGGDIKETYAYYGGTFADTANIPLDGKYTFEELGTPFYYLPVEGKNPLDCWNRRRVFGR